VSLANPRLTVDIYDARRTGVSEHRSNLVVTVDVVRETGRTRMAAVAPSPPGAIPAEREGQDRSNTLKAHFDCVAIAGDDQRVVRRPRDRNAAVTLCDRGRPRARGHD